MIVRLAALFSQMLSQEIFDAFAQGQRFKHGQNFSFNLASFRVTNEKLDQLCEQLCLIREKVSRMTCFQSSFCVSTDPDWRSNSQIFDLPVIVAFFKRAVVRLNVKIVYTAHVESFTYPQSQLS